MLESVAHDPDVIIDAPLPGVHGNRARENFYPPGAPLFKVPQNGLGSLLKNTTENFNVPTVEPALVPEAPSVEIVTSMKPDEVIEGRVVNQTEYTPELGPRMYAWFSEKEKYHISFDNYVWKNGSVSEKERRVANPPPHFSKFAREIGVTWSKLKAWAKKYPEFAEYYDACVDVIQEFIIDNGIIGEYPGQFTVFAAKNITKMKDVQINKNENWNMSDVLSQIEKMKPGQNLDDGN